MSKVLERDVGLIPREVLQPVLGKKKTRVEAVGGVVLYETHEEMLAKWRFKDKGQEEVVSGLHAHL